MKLSIIELSTLTPDNSRHDALMNSIEIGQLAEQLGYHRIWVAEHHGAEFIAGRAPEVLIAAIAAKTQHIRVGSGTVLLNHYSPLKVAEVFCTLNELYPHRIDLGVGRATTGPVIDLALQQDRSKVFHSDSDTQISELVAWLDHSFPANHPFASTPIPSLDQKPVLYLSGSSSWSAFAAAKLGLRYVFAGFINQAQAYDILTGYRNNFKAANGKSGVQEPEPILAVHAVCADTVTEARRQLAPVHLMYRNLARGIIDKRLLSPDDAVNALGGLPELDTYVPGSKRIPRFIGGTAEAVQVQLHAIAHDFAVNEIMIQDMMTDFDARKHSLTLLSKIT